MAKLTNLPVMLLLIDGDAKCTLAELIAVNSQPGTTPIAPEDLERLKTLNLNESIYVGLTQIQRIKEVAP